MSKRTMNGMIGALAAVALSAGLALACGDPAGMTHMGTVAKVDAAAGTLVLMDSQTGQPLTFEITEAQAQALRPNSHVVIRYTEDNGRLIAEEIQA